MTDLERRTALALLAGGAVSLTTGEAMADAPQTPRETLCPEVLGKLLRVAKPDQKITMEYRADRLTIEVDDQNRIKSIRVG